MLLQNRPARSGRPSAPVGIATNEPIASAFVGTLTGQCEIAPVCAKLRFIAPSDCLLFRAKNVGMKSYTAERLTTAPNQMSGHLVSNHLVGSVPYELASLVDIGKLTISI